MIASPVGEVEEKMKRFEYKSVECQFETHAELDAFLNGYGVQGWQVIKMTNFSVVFMKEINTPWPAMPYPMMPYDNVFTD